ncbi:hypothetical protein CBOM_04252 [Ceraceosorus bombacis]|uniref:Uncharacterized protein n=1 Tax=Ceraceosorus bombacis TaxID=401625 RepID=A0A0P1BQ50_9BASI|nr:hypothetical protein CBOM_04252 [Ceraceosorus bombacis]
MSWKSIAPHLLAANALVLGHPLGHSLSGAAAKAESEGLREAVAAPAARVITTFHHTHKVPAKWEPNRNYLEKVKDEVSLSEHVFYRHHPDHGWTVFNGNEQKKPKTEPPLDFIRQAYGHSMRVTEEPVENIISAERSRY